MKKFTGVVIYSRCGEIAVRKKRTYVHVYYEGNDAPIFEKGQTVVIESKSHFPITVSTWSDEHGNLIKDRVRGRYYMYSEGVKIYEC